MNGQTVSLEGEMFLTFLVHSGYIQGTMWKRKFTDKSCKCQRVNGEVLSVITFFFKQRPNKDVDTGAVSNTRKNNTKTWRAGNKPIQLEVHITTRTCFVDNPGRSLVHPPVVFHHYFWRIERFNEMGIVVFWNPLSRNVALLYAEVA